MYSTTVFLVALLGISAALPVEVDQSNVLGLAERNNALEQMVLDILEDLREVMVNGSDDIPVLDPLEVDNLHLDLGSVGIAGSYIAVGNAVISHLSTFDIESLSIGQEHWLNPFRYIMELVGNIPALEIEAEQYDLDATVAGFRIFGTGQMRARIVRPKIRANIVLSITLIPIGVSIASSNIVFELDGFESEFTGLFDGDEFLNEFVSLFLANLVPELVEFFEEDITNTISPLVTEIGNQLLENIDIGNILPLHNVEKQLQDNILSVEQSLPSLDIVV